MTHIGAIKMFGRSAQKVARLWPRVLFVDPGSGGTGIAYFKELSVLHKNPRRPGPIYRPEFSGVVLPQGANWLTKTDNVISWLNEKLEEKSLTGRVGVLVVETPELWAGHSISEAASRSGSLIKLTYLSGLIAGIVRPQYIIPVLPRQWKGQLPKDLVIKRVREAWPTLHAGDDPPDHEADALGMALAAMGAL